MNPDQLSRVDPNKHTHGAMSKRFQLPHSLSVAHTHKRQRLIHGLSHTHFSCGGKKKKKNIHMIVTAHSTSVSCEISDASQNSGVTCFHINASFTSVKPTTAFLKLFLEFDIAHSFVINFARISPPHIPLHNGVQRAGLSLTRQLRENQEISKNKSQEDKSHWSTEGEKLPKSTTPPIS